MKYIEERSSVINPIEDYKLLLNSKKKLRVKLGVDPTAPDVTLGWYSVIRALKKFQEYGHDVILILGEFTAKVGDPSGKSETRNILDDDSINENSDGVLPIIKSILHQNNLEIVSNNLIYLAAAYNGGPGNLKKWKEETNYLDDPLFFMESIPSRETRWFIEKILTKYWIYQNKNKKNMTTLKMLANGKDPLY